MKTKEKTTKLVEASVMIALATVLSLVKFADMPYGGSVTLASMLPIVIVSYRQGAGRGLSTAFAYGVIQQLIGINSLSYFTTWQSVLAVIFIDYVAAFTVIGFGGAVARLMPRGDRRAQSLGLATGVIIVSLLRYVLHVIAGATVWAGLSIPTEAALAYSIGYNATYMIPEAFITTVVAAYLGGMVDFSKKTPAPFAKDSSTVGFAAYRAIGALALVLGAAISVSEIFLNLQNAESGAFDITGLSSVDWLTVAIVSTISVMVFAVMEILHRRSN